MSGRSGPGAGGCGSRLGGTLEGRFCEPAPDERSRLLVDATAWARWRTLATPYLVLVLLRAVARTASDTRVSRTAVCADDREDCLRVRAHPGTTCTTPGPADGGGACAASTGAAETTSADATAGVPAELVSGEDVGLFVAYVVGAAGPVASAEIPSAVACSMLASTSAPPEELTAAGCGTAAASSEKTAASI
jgi:hypothetical protein